jgi:hypothetical protein
MAHDAVESIVKNPHLSKNTYELTKNILDSASSKGV